MRNLVYDCMGYVSLSFDRQFAEAVINALKDKKQDSWGYHEADGVFKICTTHKGWRCLQKGVLLDKAVKIRKQGLFAFLADHGLRIGLFFGFLISALLFVLSSLVLWDVRIVGNEQIAVAQIQEELEKAGLHVGNFLADLDCKKIANDVLRDSDVLSFVSINVDGCVAYVTVRERDINAAPPVTTGCANLVAGMDAVVESLSVSRGELKVHKGQVVRAGDLLVSGVTEGIGGNRLVYATGEIVGRVERHFSITIPDLMQSVCEKEVRTIGISLYFFGKSINIYRNTGNLPAEYVTIYQSDMWYIGKDLRLPFGVVQEKAVVSETTETKLLPDEQVSLAVRRLTEEMYLSLGEAEILQKRMRGNFTKDGYVLTCDVECFMNIAVTQEVITGGREE